MFAPVRGFKPEEGPPQRTENAARRATFAGLRRALSRDLRIHRVSRDEALRVVGSLVELGLNLATL